MKSTVETAAIITSKPYPKLMKNIDTESIWLMVNANNGTLVVRGDRVMTTLGTTSTEGYMKKMTDLPTGTKVILEQE